MFRSARAMFLFMGIVLSGGPSLSAGVLSSIVHWPEGSGCRLKYGSNTRCTIEGYVSGILPGGLCSGPMGYNASGEDGNSCGNGVQQVNYNDTWPSVQYTNLGYDGTCYFKLCFRTTLCYVHFDPALGWICGNSDYDDNYFLACDLDLNHQLGCPDPLDP